MQLNLPVSADYYPTLPWFKVLDSDVSLAILLDTFTDDEIIHAISDQTEWSEAHQVVTRETYLDIQDADRKRLPP